MAQDLDLGSRLILLRQELMRIAGALAILILLTGCSSLLSEPEACSPDSVPMCIEITKGKQQLRDELQALVMRHEGFRQHPYADNGDQSVGYGRNLTTNGISEKEARLLLNNDLDRIEDTLSRRFEVFDRLDNTRRAVLISMAYGLGVDGVSQFDAMWERLNQHDYLATASEIIVSRYCSQIGDRCIELAGMMGSGIWP